MGCNTTSVKTTSKRHVERNGMCTQMFYSVVSNKFPHLSTTKPKIFVRISNLESSVNGSYSFIGKNVFTIDNPSTFSLTPRTITCITVFDVNRNVVGFEKQELQQNVENKNSHQLGIS